MQNTNIEQFRELIESEILVAMKELAKKPEATKERLQSIARATLDLIKPNLSLDELYQNMIKLDDNFPELSPAIFKLIKIYTEKFQEK